MEGRKIKIAQILDVTDRKIAKNLFLKIRSLLFLIKKTAYPKELKSVKKDKRINLFL